MNVSSSRPHIPGYGIPEKKEGLLPWFHVTERMAQAMHYWSSFPKDATRWHIENDD